MTFDVDMLYQYGMTCVQFFVGLYFFARLLHTKIKLSACLLLGGFTVCAICVVPGGTIVQLGIFILSLAAAGIFVGHKDWKAAALYAVLTVEIMQLCYGIVKSLSSLLYPHLSVFNRYMMGAVFMLAGEAASLVLAGFFYCLVQRYFSDEKLSFQYGAGTVEKQYIFLAFVPILMIFIMDEYINTFSYGCVVTNVQGTQTYLYTNHYQMLVIQSLGMGSLFCILFAYKKLLQSFCLSTEISLLEQEEHSLNQYVEEAKTRYDRTKAFRHDIRNHIAVVKKLLQTGKEKEAVSYLEDMDDMAETMSFPCSTNNPVVDILVGNKLGIAKTMGIDVNCSLLLPCPCALRDIDLCIVLSNALDNAIHAVKSLETGMEKQIRVSGRIQGDFLMLEVENSFHGKGTFKKGTGLSNIKTVAEKYGGAMSTEIKENTFVLHVLLIIPPDSSRLSEGSSHGIR